VKRRDFLLGLLVLPYVMGVLYPIYVLIVAVFLVMRLAGFVKIAWPKKIPHVGERIILVSNHKGMLDVLLLPALLWKSCLRHPLRGPMVVADRKNFYDSWYFFLFRPFLIPVDREGNSDKSLLRIKKALDQGRLVIYFYEGGRTHKGKEFLYSESGKKIRKPKDGIGLLVSKTGADVQLLWIEGSDNAMPNVHGRMFNVSRLVLNALMFRVAVTVKVGEPMSFLQGMDKKEITRLVTESHLLLADE